MNDRVRYNLQETKRNLFFQMPKFLFEEEFNGLSNDARVLYCLLKDRHELSIKNNWVDAKSDVFLIYTREEMQFMLGLSENTVAKAMKNLKAFKLVEEERQGLGRPNKIYLLTTTNVDFTKSRKFYGSRNADIEVQQPQDLRANNTYLNNTYNIDTEYQVKSSQTEQMTLTIDNEPEQQIIQDIKKEPKTIHADQSNGLLSPLQITQYTNDYTTYEKLIKENIEYSYFLQYNKADISMVDELIFCMLDVLCTNEPTIKICGESKSRELVKSVYKKLDSMDIQHVIDQYKDQYHKITHKPSYIKTMLYNVKQEHHAHYTNLVNQHRLQEYEKKQNK